MKEDYTLKFARKFKDKESFKKYQSQHKMRPDTKVNIGGKDTTVGQASGDEGGDGSELKNKYAGGYMVFTVSILLYILISEFGPGPNVSQFALWLQVVSQKIILLIFMVAIYIQTLGLQKLQK